MPKVVYILESNVELGKIYFEILSESFEVTLLTTIKSLNVCLERGASGTPDLLVTELHLADGILYGEDNRKTTDMIRDIPVLIVTRIDEVAIIRSTLDDWADDYLTKPINNNELLAKCHLLAGEHRLFECDPVGMTVKRSGERSEELTASEFRLMTLLSQSREYTVSVEYAAVAIWGHAVADQRIHTMLSRLRTKVRKIDIQLEMIKGQSIAIHDLRRQI